MSDLEQLLPPRLHALAEDLTAGLDLTGQATAARDRHRRRRRARIGVTAVAAAVVAVAVGVPTAFSALSAPDRGGVAGPAAPTSSAPPDPSARIRAEAQALAQQAAASAAAESASAAASPGPAQQMQSRIDPAAKATMAAEEARGAAELTDALVALRAPVRLGTPAAGAACPDAGTMLSQGLGTHVGYEEGTLTDVHGGCQWSNDVDTPMGLAPNVRLTVGVEFQSAPVERIAASEEQARAFAQPGMCLIAPDAGVDARAVLQRCVNGDWVEWTLFLPAADGAGTWMLTAFIGDDLAGPDAGPALTQVARLAMTTWPA